MKISNYKTERGYLDDGYSYVAGIDEVGRGSLAGPVVAAVVALDPAAVKAGKRDAWHQQVRDSKLLSPEKRFMLEPVIKRYSLAWGIGQVSPRDIDEVNIHYATLLAMAKAVQQFRKALERFDAHGTILNVQLLIDGRFTIPNLSWKPFNITQQAIIDGDASVLSISAASILAKTYRDRLMVKLHHKFPRYEFARHKGYGTELHRQAIQKYGLTSVHRVSFCASMV